MCVKLMLIHGKILLSLRIRIEKNRTQSNTLMIKCVGGRRQRIFAMHVPYSCEQTLFVSFVAIPIVIVIMWSPQILI